MRHTPKKDGHWTRNNMMKHVELGHAWFLDKKRAWVKTVEPQMKILKTNRTTIWGCERLPILCAWSKPMILSQKHGWYSSETVAKQQGTTCYHLLWGSSEEHDSRLWIGVLLSKKSTRRGQNDEMQGNEKTRKPRKPRKPENRENRENEKTEKCGQ